MQGEGEGGEEEGPNWDRSGGCNLSANFSTLVKVSELQNYNFIRRQFLTGQTEEGSDGQQKIQRRKC